MIRVFLRVLFGCRFIYNGTVPRTGPVIFASNHLSYFDPPSVGSGIPREIHFIAKLELFKNPVFRALILFFNSIPIRRGVMDWRAMARIKELLRSGGAVILFPEGTRGREGKLGQGKFGVGMLAQETGATIVPVYIRGSQALADAFFRRRPMRILYGEAILQEGYAEFEHSTDGQLAISELVMARIAALQEQVEAQG
jgi:1-acyl-sn-glycerol-3-phosphate acyltransferase